MLLFAIGFSCQKPMEEASIPVLTNNPLRTATDSAVHRQALFVLKERPQMSFTVGVIHNGQRKLYTYGSVIKGKQQLPTENTLYEIGEVTELITAIAVVQKIQERGDSLGMSIEDLISFPKSLALDTTTTLLELFRHRSLFPKFPEGVSALEDPAFRNYPKDKFLNFVLNYKRPRSGLRESSYINLALLGVYLEQEYGASYELLYYDRIRPALGMYGSKVLTSGADEAFYPPGYDLNNREIPHWDDLGVFKCVRSVKATPKDMLHFLEWQINPEGPWGKALLYARSQFVLYIPNLKSPTQLEFLYSGGSTPGFSTSFCFNPDQKKGVLILSNHQYSFGSGLDAAEFFRAL